MRDVYKGIKRKLAQERSLLYFDLETSPIPAWVWGTGEQYVGHKQLEGESKIITAQWMFEGDKKVSYEVWDKNQNDTRVVVAITEALNKSKVAISQNGRSFDHKVLRWRTNVLNLPPIKEVEILDTLTLSRAAFRAPSHKLDYRSKIYGLGGKIPMEMSDWIAVMHKVPGALEKMIQYGCKDIPDLRGLFWKELPYYINLPGSLAVLLGMERTCCPRCASNKQSKFDVYPTKIGNKNYMECKNCLHKWKETRLKP